MTRMPTFEEIRSDFERGVRTVEQRIEHPFSHNQTPAAVPATMEPATAGPATGGTMSLLDTIKQDVAEVEAKLKGLDESALTKVSTVLANPETADVLADLNGLASIVGIPQGAIAGVAAGIKTLLSLYADPAQGTAQTATATQNVAPAVQ